MWMIYRMTSPVMRDLIMRPRDIFGVKRAVISFLAGDVYDPGGAAHVRISRHYYLSLAQALAASAARNA